MRTKFKRLLLCLTAAALLIPNIAASAAEGGADENTGAAGESDAADSGGEDSGTEVYVPRTEAETLAKMKIAAENDKLVFYYLEDEDLFALKNKETGYIWWSAPVNARGDENASTTQKTELCSALVITYGEPSSRSTTTRRSSETSKAGKRLNPTKYSEKDGGLEVVYDFKRAKIEIPVVYTLGEDYLEVSVRTDKIKEKDISAESGQLLTSLSICPSFGAAGAEDEGYFVLPDGSGAAIAFNNGKTTAAPYSQRLYGNDITTVSETKPAVTEGLSMPVYGIIKNGNALMTVAAEGDSNAVLNASVAMSTKGTSYNLCSYSFITRDSDTYYMSGINPLTVFESGGIKTPKLAVRYYPLGDETEDGSVDYVDIAARYREYLKADYGVTKTASAGYAPLYINLYGGTMKTKPILGIPISVKHSLTSYEEAKKIISQLYNSNVDSMVIGYDNWTNAGIKNQVDYKAKPSGTLGGKGDFNALLGYVAEKQLKLYPIAGNTTFESSLGYGTFTKTAIRVNGQYSRLYTYSMAFGVKDESEDTYSLLSPAAFPGVFSKLAKSYSKYDGLNGVSIGELNSALFGDYGKKAVSRDAAQDYITDGMAQIKEQVGSVLADDPNAYILPYSDDVVNIPLSSSGFDIFNDDLPFVQCVLHGLVPFASTAINGDADSEKSLLLAVAYGSNLHYDMIHAEASELKDTVYDIYYYANSAYWISSAASEYAFAKNFLEPVSDSEIVSLSDKEGVITTTYANGTVTVVDLNTGMCSVNGTGYSLSDFITEGDMIF